MKVKKFLIFLFLDYATFVSSLISSELNCVNVRGNHHPDFVPFLPGYNQPLPSFWYSGYLTYEFENRTIHTHYTLVEAEDNEDERKPLIYWSNGGPGASSLFGLLTELGPLLLNELSLLTDDYRKTNIPTPLYNPNSWTRIGHILVFDQPAPIGFSYCNNSTDSHSCDGLSWTDELTAKNALAAMVAFRNKFPCLDTDLYLTGESYAGIYVPTLAREIIQYNAERGTEVIPLKGFAVGDGCLGTETGICVSLSPKNTNGFDYWLLLFLAGHGQIPLKTFHEAVFACTGHQSHENTPFSPLLLNPEYLRSFANRFTSTPVEDFGNSLSCQSALQKVHDQVGGVYDYGLYDECTYTNGLLKSYIEHYNKYLDLRLSPEYHRLVKLNGALNDYPCGGDIVMEQMYLTLQSVQDALHVHSKWFSVDNAGLDFDYTPTEPDLTKFYKILNRDHDKLGIKVLIYNGDTDPAITSLAAQNWTSNLGFTEKIPWRPWTVDGCRRIGGYVTRYAGNFDFLTIRGAGHMVPTHKAAAAFTFVKSWIQGEDYPTYNQSCVAPSGALFVDKY